MRACGAWVWTRGLGGHVKRGRLIVFEGLDGCGKSTQLRRVAEALRERGLDPVVTREPTDGAWGRRIREMAQSGRAVAPETELAWFFEDRREHMRDVVRPALEAGRLVLSDRSYLSTVAYQGARGLDAAKILADSEAEFERPDCVLLFVIPAREGLARVAARGGVAEPVFENLEFLERVEAIFEGLDLPGLVRIDGRRSEDAIAAEVLAVVLGQLDGLHEAMP
ncbi:MAG TPA: dTMP kinase [Myxococcota bacterium]|nr:dTMP kinase [Myxococcota bacterium]